MTRKKQALRDWHRLFGLLLADFFTGSPFAVEVERDLSEQQQFLDVAIVRRGQGRVVGRLPDGLDDLTDHNLFSFKSHHEALDDWALRELLAHHVAYRKLVSPSPSQLLPASQFRLYAVAARFPHNLAAQVPWQERQPGVYDCHWGLDTVRVIVAGKLPREPHNAPLHLFSASPRLLDFAGGAYQPRSQRTSRMLNELFETLKAEGLGMTYTMRDWERDYFKKHFPKLTPAERREALQALTPTEWQETLQALTPTERREMLQALTPTERREMLQALTPTERREMVQALPLEERLAGISVEQVRQYLDQLTTRRSSRPRKTRRKK